MRNLIKQILREEVQILPNVRRRLRLGNIANDMKKNALSHYEKGKSPNIIINQAARFTAADIVPWHDEQGADYDDDTHEGWINSVKDFLIKKYGNETMEYLNKVLTNDVFNDDGNNYTLIKHSEPNGGSGFSQVYKSWGELLIDKGWWFPLDWWEIKDKLNNMESGGIRILKPGDEHNEFGYYFSIRKEPHV